MSELVQNTNELKRVDTQLKKQNSFAQSFIRGLITALGATVGLSIVVGVVAFIADLVAKTFGFSNVVQPVLTLIKK